MEDNMKGLWNNNNNNMLLAKSKRNININEIKDTGNNISK